MLDFDRRIAEAFSLFMRSYMMHNKDKKSALYMYEYETILKTNGIPVCRVVSKGDNVDILEIGENCR